MFHTASYFPLKQAGDFSLWNYICVCMCLWVYLCVCACVFFMSFFKIYIYIYEHDRIRQRQAVLLVWNKEVARFFSITRQIVSRILPPCNVTLTHWHVKWELQRRRKESQRGRDERWEMERRGQREGEIENTLEKFAERYHKWHRQFLWKNYFIIISIPKRIERKALKEEGQVTLRGIRGNAYPPHTHTHTRSLNMAQYDFMCSWKSKILFS